MHTFHLLTCTLVAPLIIFYVIKASAEKYATIIFALVYLGCCSSSTLVAAVPHVRHINNVVIISAYTYTYSYTQIERTHTHTQAQPQPSKQFYY